MKQKILFGLGLLFLSTCCKSTAFCQALASKHQEKILAMMEETRLGWNEGNLEKFMSGYWNSDSLLFIGSSGVTRGWASTLANYQRSYPDKAAMGQLTFGFYKMEALGPKTALVIGSWRLDRDKDVLKGWFSLTLRRFGKEWKIVADHSS